MLNAAKIVQTQDQVRSALKIIMCSNDDEFCIKNDELDQLDSMFDQMDDVSKDDEVSIKTTNFVSKTRNCALMMMNFVSGCERGG